MRKKRGIIAYVLSLLMIVTSLPTQTFAESSRNALHEEISIINGLEQQVTTSAGLQINEQTKYVGNGYEVSFKVTNKWDGAFNGEISITNTSNEIIENWGLVFDFQHEITNMWNAQVTKHENTSYSIKNMGWNQDIAVGQSITIGFQAHYQDAIIAPSSYMINSKKQKVDASCYRANLAITNYWGNGYNGEIIIENLSKSTIEDWSLEFDFEGSINNFWTADIIEHTDDHYVIKNRGYNANILAGQSIKLGFSGDGLNSSSINGKSFELYAVNEVTPTGDIDYEKDTDQDELPDYYEEEIGTDPLNPDSDGDGLPDGYEYWELITDPLLADSDNNGISDADEDFDKDNLSNIEEYKLGTDPYNNDSDEDGLLDGDEVNKFKTNPLVVDTIDYELDSDADGLADGIEMRLGTDLNDPDSDVDGLPDGYEAFTAGTDPLRSDSDDNGINDGEEDQDQDGLTNLEEYRLGTDPNKADTDNDKLLDGEEINKYHTNPLAFDTDGDTLGDGDEVKIGLDPLKTSTNGIADNEYSFEQSVSDEALKYVNTEDNAYTIDIDVKATGNAADNIVVANSQFNQALSGNEAITGKVIDIDYYNGKIEEGSLNFTLEPEALDKAIINTNSKIQDLRRYYVFYYNEEIGTLVPVPTTYDDAHHKITGEMINTGTYCLLDLQTWFNDIGIIEEPIKLAENSNIKVAGTSYNEEIKILKNRASLSNFDAMPTILRDNTSDKETKKINKKVDLVYVIDTGNSMTGLIKNVKSNIDYTLNALEEAGLDVRVSIIDTKNITDETITTPIKINGVEAKTAIEDAALCFTSDRDKVNELLENLTFAGDDINSSGLEVGTQYAGVSYATTLPYRQNASKFVLLYTNKNSGRENDLGFNTIFDILDALSSKQISFSVSTMNRVAGKYTVQNYKRHIDRVGNGVYIPLLNIDNFAVRFPDFVKSNLYEEKEFTVLKYHSLEKIELEAPLVKGGATDTDKDGLTDSKEVHWGNKFLLEHTVGLGSDGYELPTLNEVWEDCAKQYDFKLDEFPEMETINASEIRVLPLNSDPTMVDSDGDGLLDPEDDKPFKNDFKAIWYKVPCGDCNVYAVQEKFGEENQYIIDFDNNIVYSWNEKKWINSNKQIDEAISLKNYKITDIGICDEAGYLVSVNVDQQFKTDTAFQAIQVIGDTGQLQNDLEAAHLGIYAGAIESFFPEQDKQIKAINILALLNSNYNNCLTTMTIIPSSEKVEKFLFQFVSDRSLEELEITRPYLIGKLFVQVYMTCELAKSSANILKFGGKLFIDGIAKIVAGGTVSLALPFGGEAITIPAAAVGGGEAIAGLATAVAGLPIAEMAIKSGENAYETYKDLKRAGKSKPTVNYKGKEVPVYRGGNDFTVKPSEIKVDRKTGLVKTSHGVSLDVNPDSLTKFGEVYKIDSLPEGLKIIQRGGRPEHFEIVPNEPMPLEEFQRLLNLIEASPV